MQEIMQSCTVGGWEDVMAAADDISWYVQQTTELSSCHGSEGRDSHWAFPLLSQGKPGLKVDSSLVCH